jgi:hypothetical protein
MKKVTLVFLVNSIALLSITSTTQASPVLLKNYKEIVSALKHGQNVRAVIENDNCQLTESHGDVHDSKGDFSGVEFNTFSNTHWAANNVPKNGIVTSRTEVAKFESYNYRTHTYKVFDDNTGEYTFTLSENPSKKLIESYTWTCKIDSADLGDKQSMVFYATN